MALSLTFTTPPSFLTAYRRVIGARRPGLRPGELLPRIEAVWRGVQIDAGLLGRYRQACAIEREPGLPLHYPHVLASPLHLVMLTEPEFPLKLMGSVHLRNHVVRYRPIQPGETLDLAAAIAGQRWRPQGLEIDLDSRMTDAAGATVWRETTTLLVRKKPAAEDPESPLTQIFPWPADEAGAADLLRFPVPAGAGRLYARISGDFNPIHLHPLTAKLFGFKRDLVHGMWALARATAGMAELESAGPVRLDVAFKGPLFMESDVRVQAAPIPGGRSLRLFCGSDPRPAVQVAVRAARADDEPGRPPA